MGALLQLMTLPAACMLMAWVRAGSAQAVAALLHGAVALIAGRDAARARLAASAVKVPAAAHPVAALSAAMSRAWPRLAHAARHPAVPHAFAVAGPPLRVRRIQRFPSVRAGAC